MSAFQMCSEDREPFGIPGKTVVAVTFKTPVIKRKKMLGEHGKPDSLQFVACVT